MLLHKVDPSFYPDDWTIKPLEKLAKRGSGHTPDQEYPEYWDGGVKWVSLADSSKLDKGYISATSKEISNKGIEKSSAVLLPKETVIISRDAGVGKSAVLAEPMAVSQHFIAWQCDNQVTLSSWFLYYWLQFMRREFERQAVGSTIKTIGLPYIKKILLPHPKFEEQTKIAEILSTWDRAIETTQKLIDNSKAQKKALMQQLLTGKKRLPRFSGEWKTYRLGDLFHERKEINRPDLPLLSITSTKGVISRGDVGRKDTSSEDKSKYRRLCPGDIGYNTMRMWQGVSALSDKEGVVSPAYTVVTARAIANPDYMAYLFKLPRTVHDFFRHSQGLVSDTWNLKFPNFSEVKVTIPDRIEQTAIATVLKSIDGCIEKQKEALATLQLEKKSLMRQLLMGKKRVQFKEEEPV